MVRHRYCVILRDIGFLHSCKKSSRIASCSYTLGCCGGSGRVKTNVAAIPSTASCDASAHHGTPMTTVATGVNRITTIAIVFERRSMLPY